MNGRDTRQHGIELAGLFANRDQPDGKLGKKTAAGERTRERHALFGFHLGCLNGRGKDAVLQHGAGNTNGVEKRNTIADQRAESS